MYLCMYLFIQLINLFLYLLIVYYLFIYLFSYLVISLSIYLSIYHSIYLSIYCEHHCTSMYSYVSIHTIYIYRYIHIRLYIYIYASKKWMAQNVQWPFEVAPKNGTTGASQGTISQVQKHKVIQPMVNKNGTSSSGVSSSPAVFFVRKRYCENDLDRIQSHREWFPHEKIT